MKRTTIVLTKDETFALDHLRLDVGDAWTFWKKVAAFRSLDPATIIVRDDGKISALPIGHGLAWCHPIPLQCKEVTFGLRLLAA